MNHRILNVTAWAAILLTGGAKAFGTLRIHGYVLAGLRAMRSGSAQGKTGCNLPAKTVS